jgi:hypothetical protein
MEEKKCVGSHAEHICTLAQQNEFEDIKKLANNPNFMCSNCGRVANDDKNLCSPFAFTQISPGIPLE